MLILAEIMLLIVLVIGSAVLLKEHTAAQKQLGEANKLRFESYLLADQLRQSSDDLTRMVRSYAVSENRKFQHYFWDILAIRDGKLARPEHYERVYWDFMTVDKPDPPFRSGEQISLEQLMRRAGFTDTEFQLLAKAKNNSDDLVLLEEKAMMAMVGQFQGEDGRFSVHGEPDPELARSLLFGEVYHRAKVEIMAPINEFFKEIDIRTATNVSDALIQVIRYQKLLVFAFLALVANGFMLFLTTLRYHDVVIARFERTNNELKELSITDSLTNVANRRSFDQVLSQEYARHRRSKRKLSLILLDIDYFKQYNDLYGHVKGDECLKQIAKIVSECNTRPGDVVARYGGEEFACVLPETGRTGSITVSQRILKKVREASIIHEQSPNEIVTVSIGVVSSYCVADKRADELVEQADKLLYRAKESGRNRVEFLNADKVIGQSESKLIQLVWHDNYCCGNTLIDTQHRELFNLANKLMEAGLSSEEPSPVSNLLVEFLEEMDSHFQDEERLFNEIDFPGKTKHAAEHQALLKKGYKLVEKYNRSEVTVDEVFMFISSELVISHIFSSDQEYFPFIQEERSWT
ncbi:diguanylate cyclase [Vibrio hannami]|uniref:diguanylate cyclase n=1 Tax=Vibrio hannami TaxID=2717094 RepID=UPI00240F843A|nr:diguanylate cyclase [Vibrio hannami]MDG3086241.1 diguanylate cyclase [Vibrio hannami]